MTEAAPPWWRFLPTGADVPDAGRIVDAGRFGSGALSRTLRELRARLGASRAASLLKAAEVEAGDRFGVPLSLLLVTSQQPRSIEDALRLGFAIAGFAVDIRAIEGIAALGDALDDARAEVFTAVDLSLVALHARDLDEDAQSAGIVGHLAARIGTLSRAPVALAGFVADGDATARPELGPGVLRLSVPLGASSAFDDRFAGSFGAMLTRPAADRLADAAAACAARLRGRAPKLVVTDLDGTLWSGVIGEGEGEGQPVAVPEVHTAYAAALAALRRRGLVLAIASRNDPQDVAKAFGAPGMPLALDDFAARAIGWGDKASLVADVLAELGLASEHAVFVDDDPVNCAKAAARFPSMDVRLFSGDPDVFAAELAADPLLAGTPSDGAERAENYRRRAGVERLRAATPSIEDFLAGLKTTVTVLPLHTSLIPRAAELGARVNQFRFTALSPPASALSDRSSPLDFMVRLDDAFGAHGLVGLVLASREGQAARIDNLLLSCRALERGVETAMLHALANIAGRQGLVRIVARIERLARNEPARDSLSRHGFVERNGDWTYDLGEGADGLLRLDEAPPEVTMSWREWPTGRTT